MASGVTNILEVEDDDLVDFSSRHDNQKSSRRFANAEPASRDTSVLEDEEDEDYLSDTTDDVNIDTSTKSEFYLAHRFRVKPICHVHLSKIPAVYVMFFRYIYLILMFSVRAS